MTDPHRIAGQDARWISGLGLRPDGGGGYVGAEPELESASSRHTPRYVLLTADSPRRSAAARDRLVFHHAGVSLRGDDGAPLLGPPDRFQVGLAAGQGLELAGDGWALISEVSAPDPAIDERMVADRWSPATSAAAVQGLVARLGLAPHVEGGYFRELWASRGRVVTAGGPRPLASTIYYLLTTEAPLGRFHRNRSDITHLLHADGPIVYQLISPDGEWRQIVLGRDLAAGQTLRFTCPGGWWKSSHLPARAGSGLISELVMPGFDYADHEIADDALFERLFPRLRDRWAGRVRDDGPHRADV